MYKSLVFVRRLLVPFLALAVGIAPAAVAEPTPSGQFAVIPPAAAVVDGEFLVDATSEQAASAGLTVVREVGFGWALVRQPPGQARSAVDDAAQLSASTAFDVVPNYIYNLAEEPLFPEQWSLENTGANGGTIDADIDILAAWNVTTGSSEVTIAVLDTGVAFAHADLSSSIWTNTGEISGNHLDDDGNGYVDDVRGWDAVDNDADPSDSHGHGTFVSTIAAAPQNGVGIAGVAPQSKIMPVRVCGASSCPNSAIVAGIAYAIENGADVINLSLGGYGDSGVMEIAIREAINAGIVVVAAAGNDSVNNDINPFYPASYDIGGLISVAASDRNDGLASFSNFGAETVDLVAPGHSVWGGRLPNSWGAGSGTSFAAPKVAGVAALVIADRPALNAVQVANLVTGSVDILSHLSTKVASSGRLNAGRAVSTPQPQGSAGDEQFFYRASDGLFLYYDVSSSGALTSLLRSGKYSPGWSSIMAIDLDGDGRDEQFFYRASDGLFLYYDVSSSGALTSLLRSGKYSPGWSSIMAIDLDGDGRDEQFFYRASDGLFLYYDVSSSGALTSLLRSGKYSPGWSSIMAIDLDGDGRDEQFFYRASDGLFLYYDVSSSGALTSLLRSGKYSPGWSSIMAIDLDGDGRDEQFFYRASDGLFLYYDVSSSGALTSLLRSGKYSPGWSSIMAIDLDS